MPKRGKLGASFGDSAHESEKVPEPPTGRATPNAPETLPEPRAQREASPTTRRGAQSRVPNAPSPGGPTRPLPTKASARPSMLDVSRFGSFERAVAIVSGLAGIAAFLWPDIPIYVKVACILLFAWLFITFRSEPPRLKTFFAGVAVLLVGTIVVHVAVQPSAQATYVDEYLRDTQEANIWLGAVAMDPTARQYMLDHYSAFDPETYHYEYDLPGASPVELVSLVKGLPRGNGPSGSVIVLGQASAISKVGDDEWVIQLLPIPVGERNEWRDLKIGQQAVTYSTGTLDDLYPPKGFDAVKEQATIYARVKLRPLDIPQDGSPVVVRGYIIAYGRTVVGSGKIFDTLYLAGSSGRVNE